MKFSKNLKIMFINLMLAPFIMFGYTHTIEIEKFDQIKFDTEYIQPDDFFIDVNGNIDKSCRLNWKHIKTDELEDGFTCKVSCSRLDNLFQVHPLIEKYVYLSDELKLVVKKLDNEIVDEQKIDYYSLYANEKGEFIDSIAIKDLFVFENGTYNVFLYDNEELLGSFKNVKFERTK